DRVPTFIAVTDGQETSRLVGTTNEEQLKQMLAMRPTDTNVVRGQSTDNAAVLNAAGQSQTGRRGAPQVQQVSQTDFTGNPFAAAPPGGSASAIDVQQLLEATVKISVEDADGKSAGTGTIVDAREGAALLLTCGHIFRSSEGKGPITITLFRAT